MLMAWRENGVVKIADKPMEEIRMPLFPFTDRKEAEEVLLEARKQRDDVKSFVMPNSIGKVFYPSFQ
jgi:hypothetical protein